MEAPLLPGFKLDLTFFGLSKSHRAKLHEQIFDIIWAGQGRWSWDDIYHMPIPMRMFWINRINDKIEIANSPKNTASSTPRAPRHKTS